MDKQQLLHHITDYLAEKGVSDLSRPFHCLNPAHPDRHPSMRFDPKRDRVHCFACGADYDLVSLIALDSGLSPADAFREARQKYDPAFAKRNYVRRSPAVSAKKPSREETGAATQTLRDYIFSCWQQAGKTDYFARRGVPQELIDRYRLGYDAALDCVVLPCGADSFVRRQVKEKKYLNRKGQPSPLFNTGYLREETPVFVVEGYFDALAVEALGQRALALNGAANAGKLARLIETEGCAAPLLLLPDRDEAGEKWAAMLLSRCGETCFAAEPLPACKDISELYTTDRQAAAALLTRSLAALSGRQTAGLADAAQQQLSYLETSAGGNLPALLSFIHAPMRVGAVPTGFPALDARLDGGLYPGLYVLGAVSSLGKTAFVMQLADQLAAGGTDVLVFSLEMSRFELMGRSISRESFQGAPVDMRRYAKTVRGVLEGRRYEGYSAAEREALTAAITRYSAYADHLFLQEGDHETGLTEIEDAVSRHLALTGRTPVVLVDYLQILAPMDVHFSDKQNVDRLVCGLKKLSRTYETPVLAVSSFNREHYGQPATMAAFKESGGIDYSADVLLGLQARGAGRQGFDLDGEKRRDPRRLELKILKNRSGALGEPLPLRFYPAYSYFEEGD